MPKIACVVSNLATPRGLWGGDDGPDPPAVGRAQDLHHGVQQEGGDPGPVGALGPREGGLKIVIHMTKNSNHWVATSSDMPPLVRSRGDRCPARDCDGEREEPPRRVPFISIFGISFISIFGTLGMSRFGYSIRNAIQFLGNHCRMAIGSCCYVWNYYF